MFVVYNLSILFYKFETNVRISFLQVPKPTDCVGVLTINNKETSNIKFKINISQYNFEAKPNY